MKRLIPVIHIKDEMQAIYEATKCQRLGLGCFLIHHRRNYRELFRVAQKVHDAWPSLWIGVNALDLGAKKALEFTPRWANAIWTDDGGVFESDGLVNSDWAKTVVEKEIELKSEFEYFGGTAFKYQAPVTLFEEVALAAAETMDVVTTSGDGTGIAADVDKIEKMARGVARANTNRLAGERKARLGIASGITPENVRNYLPYVDDFLVSTGISDDEYSLNEDRAKLLRDKIYSYEQQYISAN